jgi:hypothetical protein
MSDRELTEAELLRDLDGVPGRLSGPTEVADIASDIKRIADGIDSLVKLADAVAGKWLDEFERVRR